MTLSFRITLDPVVIRLDPVTLAALGSLVAGKITDLALTLDQRFIRLETLMGKVDDKVDKLTADLDALKVSQESMIQRVSTDMDGLKTTLGQVRTDLAAALANNQAPTQATLDKLDAADATVTALKDVTDTFDVENPQPVPPAG